MLIFSNVFHTLPCGLCLLPLAAGTPRVSAPQYTTMHYVLMVVTLLVVAAFVIGILVLVRRERERRQVRTKPRRTLIKVKPRQTDEGRAGRTDGALVMEDLVDGHLTIAHAPRSTTYVKKNSLST